MFISTSEHHKRKEVYSIRTGFVAKHLEDFPLRKLESCQRYLSVNQKIVVLIFKQKHIRMTSKNTLPLSQKISPHKNRACHSWSWFNGLHMSGFCLHIFDTETRHISLHSPAPDYDSAQKPDICRYTLLLPTVIDSILCADSDNFWDSVHNNTIVLLCTAPYYFKEIVLRIFSSLHVNLKR